MEVSSGFDSEVVVYSFCDCDAVEFCKGDQILAGSAFVTLREVGCPFTEGNT